MYSMFNNERSISWLRHLIGFFFSSKEKKVVQDISGSYHHNGRIMYARAIAEQFQLDWPR